MMSAPDLGSQCHAHRLPTVVLCLQGPQGFNDGVEMLEPSIEGSRTSSLQCSPLVVHRVSPPWCVHRTHNYPGNHTEWTDVWVYAADTLLHELLLISEHRTFDPEEVGKGVVGYS